MGLHLRFLVNLRNQLVKVSQARTIPASFTCGEAMGKSPSESLGIPVFGANNGEFISSLRTCEELFHVHSASENPSDHFQGQ